jgi:hypothetical protein
MTTSFSRNVCVSRLVGLVAQMMKDWNEPESVTQRAAIEDLC